jgi:hypothetical protein
MNEFHRYLNVPFVYPKPKIFEHPADDFIIFIKKDQIYRPFQEWIETKNLTISNIIEGFYTKPNGGKIPLHTDTHYLPGERDLCKLNFTWGPLDSTTQWFKVKDESKLIEFTHESEGINREIDQSGIVPDIDIGKNFTAKWEDVDMVYEAVIDRPSLLNIGQLHSTHNPSTTEHRWTLSFTLLEEGRVLTFQRALEVFKECLQN